MRKSARKIAKTIAYTKKFLKIKDGGVIHYQHREPSVHGDRLAVKDFTRKYPSILVEPEDKGRLGYHIDGYGRDGIYFSVWFNPDKKGAINSYSLIFDEVFYDLLMGPTSFEAILEIKLNSRNDYKKHLKSVAKGFSDNIFGRINISSDLRDYAQSTANWLDGLPGTLSNSSTNACVEIVQMDPIDFLGLYCA